MLYKALTLPFEKYFSKLPKIVFDILFYAILLFTFLGCTNFFHLQGVFVLVSLVLALIYIFLKGKILLDYTLVFSFTFALFYSISAFVYYRDNFLTTALYAFSLVIFIQLFHCFEDKKKMVYWLSGAYVAGLFLAFLLTVIKTFWVQGPAFGGDVVNDFWSNGVVSRTGLTLYEIGYLGVAFALLTFKNTLRRWYTVPLILLSLFFCIYVSLSVGNRSFIVAFAILLYFLILYKVLASKKWIKWLVVLIIYSVIFIGLILMIVLVGRGIITIPPALMEITIIRRLFTINPMAGRPEIWAKFFTEFYRFPFGGFSQHNNIGYVHNLLLDFYSFGGIVPFILATVFFVYLFRYLIKFVKMKGVPRFDKGICYCVIFAIIGIGFIEPIYQANQNCVVPLFLIFLYMQYAIRNKEAFELQAKPEEADELTTPMVSTGLVNSFNEYVFLSKESESENNESAIILVTFDKDEALKNSFNNLLKVDYLGKKVDLIISIDYSGESEVEELAKSFNWPYGNLIVKAFKQRQGLKNHILQCFEYAEKYDVVFILEDDIYVSEAMFAYGYNAAKFYDNDSNISGISLYNFQGNWQNWAYRFEPFNSGYDNYFIRLAQSWGEVVTTKQWLAFKAWYNENKEFVKDGQNVASINRWPESSWLKYFHRYCFLNNKFFAYPYISLASNGNGTGIHNTKVTNDFQCELQGRVKEYKFQEFKLGDPDVIAYDEYFNPLWINKYVGYSEDELTIDLWCTKEKKQFKKYVLTAGYYGKKYIKSYSLSLHPIELSIINEIEGTGIYLYESETIKRRRPRQYNLMNYSLRTSDWRRIKFYSTILFFKTSIFLVVKKIKQLFK